MDTTRPTSLLFLRSIHEKAFPMRTCPHRDRTGIGDVARCVAQGFLASYSEVLYTLIEVHTGFWPGIGGPNENAI